MNQNLVVILCSRSNSQHKKTILSRCNNKSSHLFPLLMFCQARAWKTPYNPRGEFKITNVLAKLHRAAHVSLPNPYGWFKGWKLRNLGLNDNSPALHRKSSPMALEAWSIQLANHHKNDLLWRARNLAQTTPPLPNKASHWYWTNSFLDHCHQQSTTKLLGFTSKDPLGVAHPHSIKIFSVQPPSLNHSTALSRVLFLETWMHVSSSLIDVHVGSQPPQAFTSEKFKQTQFTNMQASANI